MSNTNRYKFNIERSILFLPEQNQLLVDGVSIRMEPLQVKLLQVLIKYHGDVMSTSRLASLVWQRENVSDNLVRQVISQLRTHLSDNERPHKIIQTIPKKGYFLLPEVLCIDDINMAEKELHLSIKEAQPNHRHGYKKTIMMMACFASLMIAVYSAQLYFKKNVSNSEPLSIYLSSSMSDDKIDNAFIASMQNYIYYTLRTAKNINVFLLNKFTTQSDQHKNTYRLITNYHRYSDEYKLTIDIYDHENIFITTFSTTFSKVNFLLNIGNLTLDIKEYLSPNSINHSIFFK
ncbi:winged helix-turn-helix domain-containing protein, partial [Aeromonas finlandensis]|uniref:winged helix-turn-helix domain-containing protein n=1 Tax=Aeromonas finlandensis TaxID=1543375 RepID=UPI0012E0025D